MDAEKLDFFRRRLLKLKEDYQREKEALEGECLHHSPKDQSSNLSAYTIHIADIAGEAYEQEKEIGIVESLSSTLYEIDEALRRMDEGMFGVCEECKEEINPERLETLPFARLCIDCQRKKEKG
jgi:RNA polymerase-binding protein DksA